MKLSGLYILMAGLLGASAAAACGVNEHEVCEATTTRCEDHNVCDSYDEHHACTHEHTERVCREVCIQYGCRPN